MKTNHCKHFFLTLLLVTCAAFFIPLHVHAQQPVLKVGIIQHAPSTYDQQVHAANVAVAHELGKKTNHKVKIITVTNQKQLKNKLKDGKVDAALSYFPQKKQDYLSSAPVFYVNNVLFRRTDGKQSSLHKLANKKIGLLTTGPQTSLLKDLQLKSYRYRSIAKLITALKKKKIQAAILTGPQYSSYLQKHPELVQAHDHTDLDQKAQVLKRISDPQVTGQTIRVLTYKKGKLAHQLNSALTSLRQTGQLNKISVKYFGKNLTLE